MQKHKQEINTNRVYIVQQFDNYFLQCLILHFKNVNIYFQIVLYFHKYIIYKPHDLTRNRLNACGHRPLLRILCVTELSFCFYNLF